uniref:CBL1 n=1 Tax=Arundo donax TaxID=35708 RepID=A0A0A9D7G9_ARUDO
MTPLFFTSKRSNIRLAKRFSFRWFLNNASWNSSLLIRPSSITEPLMLLNSSNRASTSLTLKAVWEARFTGSSYPGCCRFAVEWKHPIPRGAGPEDANQSLTTNPLAPRRANESQITSSHNHRHAPS